MNKSVKHKTQHTKRYTETLQSQVEGEMGRAPDGAPQNTNRRQDQKPGKEHRKAKGHNNLAKADFRPHKCAQSSSNSQTS